MGGVKHALNGVGPRIVTREARAGGGQKRERQERAKTEIPRAIHAHPHLGRGGCRTVRDFPDWPVGCTGDWMTSDDGVMKPRCSQEQSQANSRGGPWDDGLGIRGIRTCRCTGGCPPAELCVLCPPFLDTSF